MNFKCTLELINQDEFKAFLENAKEKSKSGEPFTDIFCMKFANGNEQTFKFSFNQEDCFYFEESKIT